MGNVQFYVFLFSKDYFDANEDIRFNNQGFSGQTTFASVVPNPTVISVQALSSFSSIKFSQTNSIDYSLTISSTDSSLSLSSSSQNCSFDFVLLTILTRICPTDHLYYNTSDKLCYTACSPRYYVDTTYYLCTKCRYDCFTCDSTGNICVSCNSTTDFRLLNGSSCVPMGGYF